jgi:hypothetical protein
MAFNLLLLPLFAGYNLLHRFCLAKYRPQTFVEAFAAHVGR